MSIIHAFIVDLILFIVLLLMLGFFNKGERVGERKKKINYPRFHTCRGACEFYFRVHIQIISCVSLVSQQISRGNKLLTDQPLVRNNPFHEYNQINYVLSYKLRL